MSEHHVAQVLGAAAEDRVARMLRAQGWRLLGRNVRIGRGELDIVAVDPGPPLALVVVEVRHRAGRSFGLPEESLDPAKRAVLGRTVGRLLAVGVLPDGRPLPRLPVRSGLVCSEAGRGGDEPAIRHHRGIAIGRRA